MERYSHWAMSYPLIPGGDGNVMQGHADYCAEWGHATYTDNGIVASWCPRCGNWTGTRVSTPRLLPSEGTEEFTAMWEHHNRD